MNRKEAERKRARAIKVLRDTGMSDEEIEAAIESDGEDSESEIIDAEIVENLPAVIRSVSSERESPTPEVTPGKIEPSNDARIQRPYGGFAPGEAPSGYAVQHDSALANNPERRCVASNSKGERCRKFAIAGSTVCRTHGGATRHVVSKARIRVEMASNRLMGKLVEFAFDDTKPPAVQLDAIKDSLNRAGISKPAQVEVGPIKPHEEIFDDIAGGVTRADSRRARGLEDDTDSVDLIASGQISPHGYFDDSNPYHPASAMSDREAESPEQRDSDRPRATETDRQRSRDRYRPTGHIVTGEDAIRLANEANAEHGSLRALPPGRSG
jgi:hypothetical protein